MTKTFAKIFLSFFHHCVKIKLNFPKLQSFFDFSGEFDHVAKRKSVNRSVKVSQNERNTKQSEVSNSYMFANAFRQYLSRASRVLSFTMQFLQKNIYKLHSE
jgi:hypothetical protein